MKMHPTTKHLITSQQFMRQYNADMKKLAGDFSFATIASHIETVVAMMAAYDSHTGSHLCNAEDIAAHVARRLELPYSDVLSVTVGALVHDIGKLGVPHNIITKAKALTSEERQQVEQHVVIGKIILDNWKSPWPLSDYAHMHHERLDGSGYPQKLIGDQIPFNVRILSAVDVAEALMADRPYRTPWTLTQVLDYLYARADQYDTRVVQAIETYKR